MAGSLTFYVMEREFKPIVMKPYEDCGDGGFCV
jgi:hypothetical protein